MSGGRHDTHCGTSITQRDGHSWNAEPSEHAAVVGDLVVDVALAFEEVVDLAFDAAVVVFEEFDAVRDGVVAGPGEFGEAEHLGDRHAGVAQAAEHAEPADVLLGEAALACGVAFDAFEQADLLVVAQGVEGEAGLLHDFGGGVNGHGEKDRTWSNSRSSSRSRRPICGGKSGKNGSLTWSVLQNPSSKAWISHSAPSP